MKGIGKHPIPRDWVRSATTDHHTIRGWFDARPHINIGIVCGAQSGIFVLDIDGPEGLQSLQELERANGPLPLTPVFITGTDGLHFVFRYPDTRAIRIPTKTRIVLGIDVRGEGGQIIAPPSQNAFGDYCLSSHAAPLGFESVPGVQQCVPVSEAPDWLLSIISSQIVAESSMQLHRSSGRFNIAAAISGVPEGQRDTVLFRLACKMRDEDIPLDMALDWIRRAAQNCSPPFPIPVAEEKVRRAYARYTPRIRWDTVIASEKASAPNSEWGKPVELFAKTGPPFPSGIVPPWVQEYIERVAEEIQVPTSMVASLMLAAVSASVAKKGVIRIAPMWREPLNLYVVVACPPSSRKSPTFATVTAPIIEYQKFLVQQFEERRAAAQFEHGALKMRIERIKKELSREGGEIAITEDIIALQKRVNELSIVDIPRIIADDVTPEKLASLLFANQERIAILSAEGNDIFKQMGAKYKSIADPTLYIKGWSGDHKTVDRMGRSEHLHNPIITMAIAIQPRLLGGIARSEAADQGLLARILYCLPEDNVGRRVVRSEINSGELYRIQQVYSDRLSRLLQIPVPERVVTPSGVVQNSTNVIVFDEDALQTFLAFEKSLEKLRGETVDDDRREWLGKLGGQTARIIGVLHLLETIDYCDNINDVWNFPVSGEVTEWGIQLALWFKEHADVAFTHMRDDPVHNLARILVRWFRSSHIREFFKSDALQKLETTGEKTAATLQYLVDRGYIRPLGNSRTVENIKYEVNPHVHDDKKTE